MTMNVKVVSLTWKSHVAPLVRAAAKLDWLELTAHSSTGLDDDPLRVQEIVRGFKDADILLFYRSSEGFWKIGRASCRERV